MIYQFLFILGTLVGAAQAKDCGDITLTDENISPEIIADLASCHTINGHLKIHMVNLQNVSLPNLVMVRDYVLLHRVSGFYSVADLFPRLSMIGGYKLLYEHALLVISNTELEEIGSWNMQSIRRGSVHFESNVLMCVGPPSNWQKITHRDYWGKNSFMNNLQWCPFDNCEELGFCEVTKKVCSTHPLGCPSIDDFDCSPECVEGCVTAGSKQKCKACNHFQIRGDECVECPTGYVPTENAQEKLNHCQEKKIPCYSQTVTSGNTGEGLKGCSTILGNLDIELTHRVDVEKLEENFSRLKVVTGYVRIVGASSLFSLSFLNGLERIGDNKTLLMSSKQKGYGLYIMDNANLRELWDWNVRSTNLTIGGKVFIRFNDVLCPQHVEALERAIKISSNDIDAVSNGKRTQCKVFISEICARITDKVGVVNVSWAHFYGGIIQAILGYNIFYRPVENLTSKYEGKDACNDNSLWKKATFEIGNYVANGSVLTQQITDLRLNQKYAIYVESYALEDEQNSVQTNITYITVAEPPPPSITEVKVTNTSMNINWTGNTGTVGFFLVSVHVKQQGYESMEKNANQDCNSQKKPARNPEFNRSSSLTHINFPFGVDKQKILERSQIEKDINAAIASHFIFIREEKEDKMEPQADVRFSSNTNIPQNASRSILWDDDPIPICETDQWRIGDDGFTYSTETNSSSIQLNFFEKFSPQKAYFIEVQVMACQSKIENCTKFLNTNESCALCSSLSSNHTYIGDSVTPKIEDVEDISKEKFPNVTHACSNKTELRGAANVIRLTWDDLPLMESYKINIIDDQTREITVGQIDSSLLNGTCWISVSTNDLYEINFSGIISGHRIALFHGKIVDFQDHWRYIRAALFIIGAFFAIILAIVIGKTVCDYLRTKDKEITMSYNPKYNGHCVPTDEPGHSGEHSKSVGETSALNEIQEESDDDQSKPVEYLGDALPAAILDGEILFQEELGCGEFGSVYKGELRKANGDTEIVAYKILEGRGASNVDTDRKARNEAFRVLCLDSQYIVKCLGLKTGRITKIVFEYMPNGDVKKLLSSGTIPVSWSGTLTEFKLKISLDTIKALLYLWKNYIVHGDVACRNILMDNYGNFKLADFGLAQRLRLDDSSIHEVSEKFSSLMTDPQVWRGGDERLRPWRTPPEGPQNYVRNSDVWFFGMLIAEICVDGRDPFPKTEFISENIGEKIKELHRKLPEPSTDLEGFTHLMVSCLQVDPEDRASPPCIIPVIEDMYKRLNEC